jgi:hypothetical protein
MYQQPPPELLVIICAVVVGISAGANLMLYTIPPAMMAFVACAVAPPWVMLIARGGMVDYALAAYTVIYLASCLCLLDKRTRTSSQASRYGFRTLTWLLKLMRPTARSRAFWPT